MVKNKSRPLSNAAAFLPLFLALSFACFLFTRAASIEKSAKAAPPLSQEQSADFERAMDALYPERTQTLRALPYEPPAADFELAAGAAILADYESGYVLYQKNADAIVPPASMTKLFLMQCVLEKVRRGEANLLQTIPLDERSWAASAPPHSSLMFLGKGQIVTLEELLTGLSVASGNDAAAAIAYSLYGSMDDFLRSANGLVRATGLKKTVIVEPSGYSEANLTTPREMAAFCRLYVKNYPDALQKFHSIKNFVYPKERNLPPEQRGRAPQDFSRGIPKEIWTQFDFENTNKLLGVLPGCDGIKTGHINESGYNLALTTKRGDQRFISVTMLGPGETLAQGDAGRCADGRALHEWAYKNFRRFEPVAFSQTEFVVPLYGSERTFARLVAARSGALPVPKNASVSIKASAPSFLFGAIKLGQECGAIEIVDGERLLQRVPLVAQEESRAANQFIQRSDEIILRLKGARR